MQDLEYVTNCPADFYFKRAHSAVLARKISHRQPLGFHRVAM